MQLCDSRADGGNFRLRLRYGDVWLETSDRGHKAREARRRRLKDKVGESRRSPERDVPGKGEIERHDADDGAALLAELDLATNDLRIARETLLPKGIAQDHNAGRAIFIVGLGEAAA